MLGKKSIKNVVDSLTVRVQDPLLLAIKAVTFLVGMATILVIVTIIKVLMK